MTKMQKSALTIDGNNLHLSMPFAKVNTEKRTVCGWATLNNVDTQGDIVTAEASANAFSRARGNLREMHDKVAVGRVVDWKEDECFDNATGQFYKGVYVTAYISKGAENTWLKVLDGTLSGFSIGGEVIEDEKEFNKEAGKTVRFIKDYELVELSLVDNPANQLANVFSIQKAANGSVTDISGLAVETVIENVFYCEEDLVIQSKIAEEVVCPECGQKMKVVGWFENVGDRAEKVNSIMAKYLAPNSEGGANMFGKSKDKEEELETVETGHEAGDPTEVPTPAVGENDVDELNENEETLKAANVEEVHDESQEIVKKIDDLKSTITDSLDKVRQETTNKVTDLEKVVSDLSSLVDQKISELDDKYKGFGERLDATKNKLAALERSLEKFNSADALRKSADLEESTVKSEKTGPSWAGAFSISDWNK